MHDAARRLFAEIGRDMDVTQPARRLSPVGQTMTAIARPRPRVAPAHPRRAHGRGSPTPRRASCSGVIERLRDRGVGVLYVSHRLEEVARIASRYTVLRNGRRVADGPMASTTVEAIIQLHGRQAHRDPVPATCLPGTPLLRAEGLTGHLVRDISLEADAGVVTGIAGLAGSGAASCRCCIWVVPRVPMADVTLAGQPYRPSSPGAAHRAGVVLVPRAARPGAAPRPTPSATSTPRPWGATCGHRV
ncbi:MAG: hypothetical protein R3C32_01645 [Chloroflexota bacterium]